MTWQKGQSGNPAGKVKHSVRAEVQKLAGHRDADRKTYAQRLAAEFWLMAFTKEMNALKLDAMKTVLEQVDGKLPATTDDTHDANVALITEVLKRMQVKTS